MRIRILTCGGTIDKIYFDALSAFQVGAPQIGEVLRQAHVSVPWELTPLLRKDSLEFTDEDRAQIVAAAREAEEDRLLITHGTDTMTTTAAALEAADLGKTVVFTGSLTPAQFRESDAIFNIGCAFAAAQLLPAGVYIAMNGLVHKPSEIRKDRALNRFVRLGE